MTCRISVPLKQRDNKNGKWKIVFGIRVSGIIVRRQVDKLKRRWPGQ